MEYLLAIYGDEKAQEEHVEFLFKKSYIRDVLFR